MGARKARIWRRLYLGFTLSLGLISPLVCWYLIPDFNPITKPLSYFGVAELTAWYWNLSLLILAYGLYTNANRSVCAGFKKPHQRKILHTILLIAIVGLCLTAVISMDYQLMHRISACAFFLVYNFFVFCFGYLKSRRYVRTGIYSMCVGSLMLLSSLLLLPFPSYGVFELAYCLLLLVWNVHLFYKRIEKEDHERLTVFPKKNIQTSA